MGIGEDSSVPIYVQFTPLRRSGRQSGKRDYKKMQGPSAITSRLVKKPKLLDDACLAGPAANGSTNETSVKSLDYHPSEQPDKIPANVSATGTLDMGKLIISRLSVDCPDISKALDSSGIDDLPTSATHIQIEGDEIVDDMSPTTHSTGYEILNEFFGHSATELEAMGDIGEHGKCPEPTHQDEDLEYTGPSNAPEALDVPQHAPSTGINAVSSEDSDILEPDLFVVSAATSESSSHASSDPGSLSTGLTSASSETRIHGVKHSFLDDPAPWLEHVLTALETDDTGRQPNPVLGVLDEILTNSDFTLCVRIMTSIAEN
jgi:hypothetical protein